MALVPVQRSITATAGLGRSAWTTPARRVHGECITGTWCALPLQYSVFRMATTEPTSSRGRLGQPGSRGRDCDTCGTIAADAGGAAMMVISSPTEATIETLELADLPPEAARALLRLVCQAEQRAAARSTKGAA